MLDWINKPVLVVGLDGTGREAGVLLRRAGARVVVLDPADTPELGQEAGRLRALGIDVRLGASAPPEGDYTLALVSAAIPADAPIARALADHGIPVIGELELVFQLCKCLSIAVAGTNGKSTTAGLIERMLTSNHRKLLRAGPQDWPLGSIAELSKDLDFLLMQANSFQLERTRFLRPTVAVLLNLVPEHLDRYASPDDLVRANAALFRHQQSFDWAIVQLEALARLQALNLAPPSKIVTFSAGNQQADIHLDRGLIISRLPNWEGPLLDTGECRLPGPHNAENLMAALAVGRALRVPLDAMVESLKLHAAGPHRLELIAEIDGVRFINDSKATNVDALRGALLTAHPGEGGKPNIWLIAGGRDQGMDFHALGPEISRRVKGAFLIGEAREKIQQAWSLFTPCTPTDSLLEAVTEAAKNASVGDVVLLSPACSSSDQFQNYQQRGEKFCQAVKSISRGGHGADPNRHGR